MPKAKADAGVPDRPFRSLVNRLILWLALLGVIPAFDAAAADLRVVVDALRSVKGDVRFALYDRAEAFPDDDGKLAGQTVAVIGNQVEARFAGLNPGDYAVAVFHDENGNGEFDQGLFGIPLEGYGFSNGARAFLGPPDFAEAKVRLGTNGAAITILIDY